MSLQEGTRTAPADRPLDQLSSAVMPSDGDAAAPPLRPAVRRPFVLAAVVAASFMIVIEPTIGLNHGVTLPSS